MSARLLGCVVSAALWAAVWAGMWAGSACAEMHALLVGVSGYPTLPAHLRLSGPRNDVLRMREVLLQRGARDSNIEVLADGVTGTPLPTRGHILAAFERLAGRVRRGDVVVVHFAGHGSWQPAHPQSAQGSRESEGRQAILLPLDVGRWDGRAGAVANAIASRELRSAMDAINARGADVFAVFDACHSAALVRGTEGAQDEGGLRWRHVPPHALGLGAEAPGLHPQEGATRGGVPGLAEELLAPRANAAVPGAGKAVFFYATQANELTPELRLPPGGGAAARVHGLFSFTVARALAAGKPMSYRQLGQLILAEYGSVMEARATPLFSGNGLDALVFGQREAKVRQWPLDLGAALAVPAGTLSGLEEGAVLAVLPHAAAADSEALGHVAVTRAEPGRALVAATAWAGKPATEPGVFKAGQVARLLGSPVPLALRIGVDHRHCASPCGLARAAAVLRQRGVPGVEALWVDSTSTADIVLRQTADRIYFLAPTQRADDAAALATAPAMPILGSSSATPPVDAEVAAQLAINLHRIARARNLQRLAARAAAEPGASALRVELLRQQGEQQPAQPVSADSVPVLRSGERLKLSLANAGTVPVDVTVLYLDAHFGVTTLFPNRLGESNRLAVGARMAVDDIQVHAPPQGLERLLVIAVPARRLAERSDFSFLDQPALTMRGAHLSQDMLALADAGFAAHGERGAVRPAVPAGDLALHLFTLSVQP